MRPGLCFLFAQAYHPAMRHVAEVRRQLKTRTIFNLLGPICNPAGVRRQLLGVYARQWLRPVADVLAALGAETAWVAHGSDGLDELTTTARPCRSPGRRQDRSAHRDTGRCGYSHRHARPTQRRGRPHNADAILRLLAGEAGSFRDIVLLNAAAALIVGGKARDLRAGAAMAAESIDKGPCPHGAGQARQDIEQGRGMTILDDIALYKRQEIAAAKLRIPAKTNDERAWAAEPPPRVPRGAGESA